MTQPPSDPWGAPPPPQQPHPGPPGQPYGAPPPPYGAPYPPVGYGYPAPTPLPPKHPRSTSALVVGLVALAGGFVCGLPLLAGPVAWIMGASARREMRRRPGAYSGDGEALAGMVLGIVATVLLVVAVIGLVLFSGVVATTPEIVGPTTGV